MALNRKTRMTSRRLAAMRAAGIGIHKFFGVFKMTYKLLRNFCGALAIIGLLISYSPPTMASNPTVTVTKTFATANSKIYTITFTTNISNPDTAFIFDENGRAFTVEGLTKHPADSLVTMECYSAEATADSVRLAILYQVSSASSPTTTAGTLPNSGWVTAFVDSVTMNNKTMGLSYPGVSKFPKTRLSGQARVMRVIVHEISGTVKDATQSITLRLVIPQATVPYLWR